MAKTLTRHNVGAKEGHIDTYTKEDARREIQMTGYSDFKFSL